MSNNPFDSSTSSYQFVPVDQFTPNSGQVWTSFGKVFSCTYNAAECSFTITGMPAGTSPAPVAKIYILGPNAFRVRFNRDGDYSTNGSYAVVNQSLGTPAVNILQNDKEKLSVDLGGIRLDVLTSPFTVQVYRNGALISTDTAQGLEYIPGTDPSGAAVANFKEIPANACYFGFGEKGGSTLNMLNNSMTFFNYDNYKYDGGNVSGGGFGRVVPSFSTPGPLNSAEPLYNSVPLLIEDNPNPVSGAPYSYGIFLDNPSQSYFNIGQSSSYAGNMYGKYYFGALYGDLDYYFLAGDNTPEVIDQYTTLTGRPALPPMYVLGYHQGCYGYFSESRVLTAAQSYRLARIPLDGIHIDVDFQNNYRTFTASPSKFPGGGKPTFDSLHAMGIKASTNITGIVTIVPQDESGNVTPYPVLQDGLAKGVFIQDVRVEQNPPPSNPGDLVVNESYGVDTGVNPYQPNGSALGTYGYYADLGKQANREWWGRQYKPLLDAGLDMVWQDMTDPATQPSVSDSMPWKTLPLNVMVYDQATGAMVPHATIHNGYAMNLVSATYEGLQKLRPNQRPFIIARGGYAGIQRYAASWTGDSASDWNFMSILIPEILNFGLSGQPLAGADVGGFALSSAGGTQNGTGAYGVTDPELITRWTTLSAFIGWFRNHYDGYNKAFQEPFMYGDPVTSNCRKYIEIRYKLLQYFYDALYESTQTGLPICRPLFLTDRSDTNVYGHLDDQFMVGQNILIAPVVTPRTTYRDVYLPAGSNWFAYQDNQAPLTGPNTGGQSINWYAPVNIVPIYVRAGAIVPRRELEQYVGELDVNPLTFDVYPGPDSTHTLYQDDRITTDAQKLGSYRLTEISQSSATPGTQTVRVKRVHDQYTPPEPCYFVALLKTTQPASVTVNGQTLPFINDGSDNASADALSASSVNAYYYSQSLQTTFVKVFDVAADTTIAAMF